MLRIHSFLTIASPISLPLPSNALIVMGKAKQTGMTIVGAEDEPSIIYILIVKAHRETPWMESEQVRWI